MFFTTDLTHAAVIGVSRPIVVRQNREYKLDSYFSTVFPCHEDDVKPLTVRRPQCAGEDDKVRVFSQGIKELFLFAFTMIGFCHEKVIGLSTAISCQRRTTTSARCE